MNELLNYINVNNITNDKNILNSYERKLLKTFDFNEQDINISGVLNFVWKKKTYEVIISCDNNDKVNRILYKLFDSKDDAYAFYENIYKILFSEYGEK